MGEFLTPKMSDFYPKIGQFLTLKISEVLILKIGVFFTLKIGKFFTLKIDDFLTLNIDNFLTNFLKKCQFMPIFFEIFLFFTTFSPKMVIFRPIFYKKWSIKNQTFLARLWHAKIESGSGLVLVQNQSGSGFWQNPLVFDSGIYTLVMKLNTRGLAHSLSF